MKAVYKYKLSRSGFVTIPKGAQLLSVGAQDDALYVWAIVDLNVRSVERLISCIPTGTVLSDDHADKFIGTVLLRDGRLVFHVFDHGEVE